MNSRADFKNPEILAVELRLICDFSERLRFGRDALGARGTVSGDTFSLYDASYH